MLDNVDTIHFIKEPLFALIIDELVTVMLPEVCEEEVFPSLVFPSYKAGIMDPQWV